MSIYTDQFFAGRSETVTRSASVVAPIVRDMLSPQSLLDVGCGKGEWMEAFGLEDMLGVDIAAPEGERFLQHDLTKPLYVGRTFDLALSLEVGEHLPEQAAGFYVLSLVRHSNNVVFSAAVPGQAGNGHINCQPHEYWHEFFDFNGYDVLDEIRPLIHDRYDVSPWYRDNIFLYVRRAAGDR